MRVLGGVVAGSILLTLSASAWQTPSPQPRPSPQPGIVTGVPGMPGPPRDQPQKTGTAQLSGRVLAADTGKPIRRALVRAFAIGMPQARTISTDQDGRWALKDLPGGSYRVRAEKGGYVGIDYGQRRPFSQGMVLDLADGQVLSNLEISLPRAGVITGTVVDEFGDPVSNVRVSPLRYRYMNGQRRLVPVSPGDSTDDIGQYRLHGLSPGEYYVSASAPMHMMFGQSDDRSGYTPTFYPGTPIQSEAQRVSVSIGQETSQINFAMALSRVATISGTARSSSGKPISRGFVSLMMMSEGGMASSLGVPLKADGSFSISNVAPGQYRVQVQHVEHDTPGGVMFMGMPGAMPGAEYAAVPITVSGADITDLELVTSPAGGARGRIVFDTGQVPPEVRPAGIQLMTFATDPGVPTPSAPGRVRDDWTFEVTAVAGRRRVHVGGLPPGWYLKSITQDGLDVTDSGLDFRDGQTIADVEVVLTQRATDLSGTVQDSRGKGSTDYVVVAFSTDASRWGFQSRFVRTARPNQEGRFSLKGLPAGEYLVVALEYLEPGEESDPEGLETWRPAGQRVTLRDGEAKTVVLKVIS